MPSQIESQSPFFQFFPNDWLSSKKMARMTLEEQGAYMRLLCFMWADKDCSIEDDDQALSEYSTLGDRWFKGCGTKIKQCFIKHPEKDGFLTNKRLLEERIKQSESRRKNSRAGKISAKKRVQKLIQKTESAGNIQQERPKQDKRPLNVRSANVLTEGRRNSTLQFSDLGFQISDFRFQERDEETPIQMFLRFAQESHKAIRGSPIRIKPKQNGKTVADMLSEIPLDTLMVAWILFLQSDHHFIVKNQNPRTIPVFAIIVDDFLESAVKFLESKKNNHCDLPKPPKPPPGVDPAQAAKWQECLLGIEEQILPENFSNIFGCLAFAGIDNGKFKIICPSKNHGYFITENYGELIEGVLVKVFGVEMKPEFLVDTDDP